MIRKTLFFFALLALGLQAAPAELRPAAAQGAPYEINTILALTGPAAFIGGSEKQAFELIEGIVNKSGGIAGRPVKFVIVDDQSNPQISVQLANGFIAKGVPLILGPSFTATCLAVAPLVQKSGPVTYCLSPALLPPAGSFLYSATVGSRDDAIAIVRYFRERGWTKIALIASTDASGQYFENFFDQAMKLPENATMKLVDREHFNPTDISIAAQAERIRAAAPQAMIGWTAGTATGTMLRGLHDGGVDIPIAGGNGNMVYQQLAQYAAFIPKELYFSGRRAIAADPSAPPKIQAAEKIFFDAYLGAGVRPNLVSTIGWDPAMLFIEALRKIGPDATSTQINDFIQHTNGWVGINGVYDFRDGSQRGIGIDGVVMDRYDAAKQSFIAVSKPGGYIK